ncbi:calcium-binding protein, partial [Shimia sp. SDUM112013]|uniref:calcium-binding protein n=1 Tax=Shimia sp. SDUM112013 TaxID=3136160 RepID=UPI0032F07513
MATNLFGYSMTGVGTDGPDSLYSENHIEITNEGGVYCGLWGKGDSDSFYIQNPSNPLLTHVVVFADISWEGTPGADDTVHIDFSGTDQPIQLNAPRSVDSSNPGTFFWLQDPDTGATDFSISGTGIEHVDLVAGSGDDRFTIGHHWMNLDGGAGTDIFYHSFSRSDPQTGQIIPNAYAIHVDMAQVASATGQTLPDGSHLQNIERANLTLGTMNDSFSDFGDFDDRVSGEGGDDTLRSSGGADSLYGQDGTDTAIVDWSAQTGEVHMTMPGSSSNWLRLWIGDSADPGDPSGAYYDAETSVDLYYFERFEIRTGSGADILLATDADDNWHGGAGDDSLSGGAGNDTLDGGTGADTLWGGDGDDVLTGGAGSDSINGGHGDDTAVFDFAAPGAADVLADGGSFYITSGGDTDTVDRNVEHFQFTDRTLSSDDLLLLAAAPPTGSAVIEGTALEGQVLTADVLGIDDPNGMGIISLQWLRDGTPVDGAIMPNYMLGAEDVGAQIAVEVRYIDGIGTSESVVSTATTPVAPLPVVETGTDGNDVLRGGAANDTLSGGDGNDTLIGGDGDDVLTGGTSENDLRDVIYGGNGNDDIDGGYGNDELRGDAGNDTIEGGFGADTVIGGAGNDILTGSAWSDLIFGGDGDDFVNGGWGHDRVNGGAGADRFFHIGIRDHGSDWIQDY